MYSPTAKTTLLITAAAAIASCGGSSVGRPFGIEIQLNDDDNGAARDARFGWLEPSGSSMADSNPGVFGTALLTSCAGDSYCGMNQLLTPDFQFLNFSTGLNRSFKQPGFL